jgi:hypothetical protein
MKTTGVLPEAFAASISRLSRSEIDVVVALGRSIGVGEAVPLIVSSCVGWADASAMVGADAVRRQLRRWDHDGLRRAPRYDRRPTADNAVLFLWAVNSLLPEALQVMDAWGFEYLTNLAWIKQSIGLGRWIRNQHELLLLGRRGNYPAPDPHTLCSSVIEADRRRHSQKPDQVYELIERMYPHASKVELFARGTPRPGEGIPHPVDRGPRPRDPRDSPRHR